MYVRRDRRIVVATMPMLRPGEVATILERAQVHHAIVDERFLGLMPDLLAGALVMVELRLQHLRVLRPGAVR